MNIVTGLMSDGMISKVASMVGINSGIARTALNAVMPRILRGIASKGSTESGASALLNLIKNNGLGANLDLSDDVMASGGKINESIFGSSLNDVKIPGVSGDAKSKLMNLATPLAMGSIGKVVKDKNLDAKGLSTYLRDNVEPVKMAATTYTQATAATNSTSGGLGFLRWLLPLLVIGGIGWWWMTQKGSTAEATTSTTATTETPAAHKTTTKATYTHADGTVHEGHSHGHSSATDKMKDAANTATSTAAATGEKAKEMMVKGLSLDADGNLLRDGKMYLKSGEFTVKEGEYFDKDGKSLGFLAKVGKAIGDAGKAVGGAVGGAAGKTADFFKDTFGGMFKKKSSGEAVAAYNLSKIAFDPDSHKITSMSKNEVEGLAAALKAYPDSKITVQATGGDKKLSKMKAQVIHDMLVTLGVSDKQISAKGMGDGAEKFEIVID